MPNDAPPVTATVPLISGRVRGPLGIAHLPRLWLKLRLHAVDRLPEGYRDGEGGFDGAVVERLGLDLTALRAFIANDAPDHQAFEAWVRHHATVIASSVVDEFNASIESNDMPEPRCSEWTERFALPSYTVAARLNELDDWDLVHGQIVAADAPRTLVVPAISTTVTGPLGVSHLPRLWLKKLLYAYGRLPSDYRHGSGGFDEMLLDALGIDDDAMDAFIGTARPGYLATEAWVRDHAATLTPATIAALNARLFDHVVPDDRAAPRRARFGLDDSIKRGVVLNDVDDWYQLHEELVASR